MKKIFTLLLAALATATASAGKLTRHVDPSIGTTNFSACSPGPAVPHGLMTVTPFNVMGSGLNRYDKDKRHDARRQAAQGIPHNPRPAREGAQAGDKGGLVK